MWPPTSVWTPVDSFPSLYHPAILSTRRLIKEGIWGKIKDKTLKLEAT
jgi:hypothetical protein